MTPLSLNFKGGGVGGRGRARIGVSSVKQIVGKADSYSVDQTGAMGT